MKTIVSIGFLLIAAAFVSAQNLPSQPFPVKWKAVAGAGGYLAEVKDSNETIVVTQQVPADQVAMTLQLVPGPYSLRVTTLNRFLKPESDTGWQAFHVDAESAPVVADSAALVLPLGQAGILNLGVSGLAQDATVALKAPSGKQIPLGWSAPVDGILVVKFPVLSEPGEWALVLTNPPKKAVTITGRLSIRDTEKASSNGEYMFIYPTIFGPAIDFQDKTSGTGFGVSQTVAGELKKAELTEVLVSSYGTKQFWANVVFYPGLGLSYCGIGLPVMLIANTISGSAYEDLGRAVAAYNGPSPHKVTYELKQFGYKLLWNGTAYDPGSATLLDELSSDPGAVRFVDAYRGTSGLASTLNWTGTGLVAAGAVLALVGVGQGGWSGVGFAVLGLGGGIAGLGSWTLGSLVGASAEADLVRAVRAYNQNH